MYVYVTCSQFPSSSMQESETKSLYTIQCFVSIFMFISFHLKVLCRQILNQKSNFIIDTIDIEKFKNIQLATPLQQFLQVLNIIISDLISALGQAAIFYFGINIVNERTQIEYLWLYLGTPAVFVVVYLISFVLSQLINKQLIQKLRQRAERKKLIKFGLIQIIYFIFLGVLIAALIHLIFYSYDQLQQKYKDDYQYPDFSCEQAYDFAFAISSFFISYAGLFALYLSSPAAMVVYKLQNVNEINIFKLLYAQLNQFGRIHSKLLISNLILFGMVITSDLSDFISLIFIILSEDNQPTWEYVLSTCLSILLIILYIILIIFQSKGKTHQVFAFTTFILGLFAIPAILSINFVQNALISIMPCGWRDGFQRFLNNGLISFASIISFLQNVPLMFPQDCIYKQLQNYDQFLKQKGQQLLAVKKQVKRSEKQDNNEEQNEEQQENEEEQLEQAIEQLKTIYPKIQDYELLYSGSKHACGAMSTSLPRIKKQIISDKKLQKLVKKAKCKISKQNDKIFIAFQGTQTILSLAPAQILAGLFSWIKATFVFQKPIVIDDKHITYGSSLHYKYAQRIQQVILKLTQSGIIKQDTEIILTGNHQGSATAILASLLLLQKQYTNIHVYTFGMPHLVSQFVVEYVSEHVKQLVNIQVGTDGKLFLSEIFSNNLRYSNKYSWIIEHADNTKKTLGYFSILNTGSDPDRVMEACKIIADQKINQINSSDN